MVPYKYLYGTETNVEICIGCGACEHVCPARPQKAIIVVPNKYHKKAKPPVLKENVKNHQPKIIDEDFPF